MLDRRAGRSVIGWTPFVIAVLISCGPAAVSPGDPTGPIPPGTSSSPGSLGTIFDEPQPRDVSIALEAANAVEALIPVEGGSLSAIGDDGTLFTLDIPSDALLNETTIGLTPVASITGLPFGGEQAYAVQLSPDGLSLFNYATLTITPAVAIPIDQQVVFGYLHAGKDVIFAAPVVDSSEVKIKVLHFSGNGLTNGSQAAIDPLRERLGGDAERRLESQLNTALAHERQAQLGYPEEGYEELDVQFFEELLRQYEEQVVKPRIAAAGESCAAGALAVETVLGFERQRSLLGLDGEGNVFATYADLFNKAARVCMLEEFQACVEHHRIYLILPLYHGMLQQNSIIPMYTEGTLSEARDLTVKCLTFRLELRSTGKLNWMGMFSAESTVTADVMLRYDPAQGLISGSAEFVNTDYEVEPLEGCSVATNPGGGILAVLGLLYELEYGEPDGEGNYANARVSDLTLAYSPNNSSETATMTCPADPPDVIPLDIPVWSTAFFDAHLNELGEGGLEAVDWDVAGGELFAVKEWDLVGVADPFGSEAGSFELHHVPGG